MVEIGELQAYCDKLLASGDFDDYCPNGLQVEGDRPVNALVTGVTASQALVDAALAENADALLVHHGYFWKGEAPCLVGIKGRRIRSLMRAGVSLLAYHLPLDAHPEFGNNRRLGERLAIVDSRPTDQGRGMIWRGRLEPPVRGRDFARSLERALGRSPLHIAAHDRPLRTIAWCTGAAQGFIEDAALLGVDAFLSGEISEQTTHQARELGLDYFAAGHHATERYGVQALGAHLAARFGLTHRFLEMENPV
jgi:dinuclear metal center YbgI/SA1388 family protein